MAHIARVVAGHYPHQITQYGMQQISTAIDIISPFRQPFTRG